MTYAASIAQHDNDYTALEGAYLAATGSPLVTEAELPATTPLSRTASLVIPCHRAEDTLPLTLDALARQALTPEERARVEVVLVDDGPDQRSRDLIGPAFPFATSVVSLPRNVGPAMARNVGVAAARGEVIVFLDADIVVRASFVREHLVRHSHLAGVVLLGFRATITLEEWHASGGEPTTAALAGDFRVGKATFPAGAWCVDGTALAHAVELSPLAATEQFKRFGGALVGPFDLPAMVVTTGLSLARTSFVAVGGFCPELRTCEDMFLGVCLVASGHKIVPVLSSPSFHVLRRGQGRRYHERYDAQVLAEARARFLELRQGEVALPLDGLTRAQALLAEAGGPIRVADGRAR